MATRISAPRLSRSACLNSDAPPTTIATLTEVPLVKTSRLSAIWLTNSRVGAKISARTVLGAGGWPRSRMRCNKGRPKAAVLPVPVCARPIRSLPAMICGIACTWIGEGIFNWVFSSAFRMVSERPRSAKVVVIIVFLTARWPPSAPTALQDGGRQWEATRPRIRRMPDTVPVAEPLRAVGTSIHGLTHAHAARALWIACKWGFSGHMSSVGFL